MTTFERVYAAVKLIPRGSVATYGQIAAGTSALPASWAMRCTSTRSRASSHATASSSEMGKCQVLLLLGARTVRSSC